MKDTIFRSSGKVEKFRFDENVAQVFDDMLARSVPFYDESQKMISTIAADFYRDKSRIYDLGCSTGNTIIKIHDKLKDDKPEIIGIDSSSPVIGKAREKIKEAGIDGGEVRLLCEDIMETDISNASVVIMNYTLQFIRPEERLKLISRIFDGLADGGVLLLSEKVIENDGATTDFFVDKYHDFKRTMGYSELEIAKKREALEEVLIPFTVDKEFELLNLAGFTKTSIFFKWFNFASFMAIKGR